jgi:3-dehydroquinate dehydratase
MSLRANTRRPASKGSFKWKRGPVIVAVCVAQDAASTREAACRSVAEGADIVEVNLAQLSDYEIAQLDLARNLPYYVVCRRRSFMHVYGLEPSSLPARTDEMRMRVCLDMVHRGARALDMECDTFSGEDKQIPRSLPVDLGEFAASRETVQTQQLIIKQCEQSGAEVILSCHAGRALEQAQAVTLAGLMAERGGHLIKIVTQHSDPEYPTQLIATISEVRRSIPVPFILISMGPCSALLRVLGGYLGNAGVYCRAEGPSASFRDHSPISSLREIWRLLPPGGM